MLPRFYETGRDGVPARWVEMVRHTLRETGPKVLATRMVRDYVQALYVPAAGSARAMAGDGYGPAREEAALAVAPAAQLDERAGRPRRGDRRR